jgi:hypothetical protein
MMIALIAWNGGDENQRRGGCCRKDESEKIELTWWTGKPAASTPPLVRFALIPKTGGAN